MIRKLLAALVLATMVVPASALSGQTAGKAFPPGCWVGKGTFAGTKTIGGATVNVSNGTLTFKLVVTKKKVAVGFADVAAHASGDISANGMSASGEIDFTGNFDLTGAPGNVAVDGSYAMKGVLVVSGLDVPIDQEVPGQGKLGITSVKPATVKGTFDYVNWTAHPKVGKCV